MIAKLKLVVNKFDDESTFQKQEYLLKLSNKKLQLNNSLVQYFKLLLFISAYPDSKPVLQLAEKELSRIAAFLKKNQRKTTDLFTNSGLPFTISNATFSHDAVDWLINQSFNKIKFHSYEEAKLELNDVLKFTLPKLEISETTRGMDNEELLESLKVKEDNKIAFIISELSKLHHVPFVEDYFYDGLGICIDIIPKNKLFSKAYNRLPQKKIFFHQELIKHFDDKELLSKPIPASTILSKKERDKIVLVVKHSLLLLNRETDPVTYMDEKSLRLYKLERGISVAIYGMIPERQLPLESYVGYTLFKNGFPVAYGGGWVFGEHADFGINIFESFRGGESGYMMCSLLRVYRQVFNINYFEVEPYQIGLDNPDGITSAAFWFYFRYGFRSLEKELLKTSLTENKKINSRKGYRTSRRTLEKFAQSPIALKLGNKKPATIAYVSNQVTKMIAKEYKGIRTDAVLKSVEKFKGKTGLNTKFKKQEWQVLEEVALWAQAHKIKDKKRMDLLVEMIKVKPKNLYSYQKLLLRFFA